MSDTSGQYPSSKEPHRRPAHAYWAYDDDEDEGDYDDDEDEGIVLARNARWSSQPDFGSPEG